MAEAVAQQAVSAMKQYIESPHSLQNIILVGGGTVAVTAGGVAINGLTVTVTGGDVIADGISLKTHRHGGVQAGSGTSGPPV